VGGVHEFHERVGGYRAALEDWGLSFREENVFYGRSSFEYGYSFVMENRDAIERADGMFAQADMIAIGAIEAMKELGIRVPGDIPVVGYDDIDIDYFFKPRLTTIHQPKEEYTEIACKKLLEMIETGGNVETVQRIVEPNLLVRESCVV
jgi:LacI family transcriptional regulator